MTESPTILLADETGAPAAVLDLAALHAQGRAYACELAATSDDPTAHGRLAGELVAEGAPEVVVNALTGAALACMVREILAPLIEAAEAAGVPLRRQYAEAAEQIRAQLS